MPASMICEVRPGGHYGYGGPKDGQPPDLPLVYLPRGLDNSSGGQVVRDQRPLGAAQGPDAPLLVRRGHALPAAPRAGRRPAAGRRRAAARRVPLGRPPRPVQPEGRPALRLRHGRLGHLHRRTTAASSASATPATRCSSRSRFHAHENGVLVDLHPAARPRPSPSSRATTSPRLELPLQLRLRLARVFARAIPASPGHDPLTIRSAHVLADGRTLFLEIPDLQPVNQLHLHLRVDAGPPHRPVRHGPQARRRRSPGSPATGPSPKTIAAHPILADMAALDAKPVPEPLAARDPRAPGRSTIEAGKNLTLLHADASRVRAGEPITPDVRQPRRRAAQLGADQARARSPAVGDLVEQDHRRARRRGPPLHPADRRRARLHRHRRPRPSSSPSPSAPRPRRAAIRTSAPSPATGWS